MNQAFRTELETVAELFTAGLDPEIELQGEVYEIAFPRTVADRLFGERDEKATIFTASTRFGQFRFLVLWDSGQVAAVAVEAPSSRRPESGPEGLFLALPASESGGQDQLAGLAAAIEARLEDLEQLSRQELSSADYTLFGPFAGGRSDLLRGRITENAVMAHLANEINQAEGDVSLTAPAFLILKAPDKGVINAIYLPHLRLIQEPLWGSSETSSLTHDLVHAYMDRVPTARSALLDSTSEYFGRAHPRLYGKVVGDLYETLGPEGRAEETLAFIAGALASRQTKTVASLRLLENQGLLSIAEPILHSDIRLLIEIGLLPECMAPEGTQLPDSEISFEYYEAAALACASA